MTETVIVTLPAGDPVIADFLEATGQLDAAMVVRGAEPVVYLWLLTQDEETGYDTYDSCVVAAADEEAAKRIRPGIGEWREDKQAWTYQDGDPVLGGDWASHPDQVKVERIGATTTEKPGIIICASFNAG